MGVAPEFLGAGGAQTAGHPGFRLPGGGPRHLCVTKIWVLVAWGPVWRPPSPGDKLEDGTRRRGGQGRSCKGHAQPGHAPRGPAQKGHGPEGQRRRPGQGAPSSTVDWPPPRPGPRGPALPGRPRGHSLWSSCRPWALSTDGSWATCSGERPWGREGPCTGSDRSRLWVRGAGHSSPSAEESWQVPLTHRPTRLGAAPQAAAASPLTPDPRAGPDQPGWPELPRHPCPVPPLC